MAGCGSVNSFGVRLLLVVVVLAAISSAVACAELKAVEVNWVQFSDLSSGGDEAYGVCVHGDYVFVVGVDAAPSEPCFLR